MALSDTLTAANNPTVAAQVQQAFRYVAATVYAEATNIDGHVTRAAFASQVLSGNVNWNSLISSVCAIGDVTDSNSTDAQMEQLIQSNWSAFAGA